MFAQFIEIKPRGEQVLQRTVVQSLGEFPVAAFVGEHRLGDQSAAHVEQCRTDGTEPYVHGIGVFSAAFAAHLEAA
jgi:hypothetical protein